MVKYILTHGLRIAKDFVPRTYDRLQTLGPEFLLPVGQKGRTCAFQVCLCSCDERVVSRVDDLRSGRIRSCGCLKSETTKRVATRHGQSDSAEFKIWLHIEQRCTNPNRKGYKRYGGRGINMCPEWTSKCQDKGVAFQNFIDHIGPRPSPQHTVDRYPDRNGNYEPGNVRWATWEEQNNNRDDNRMIEYQGKTQTLAQWAKELGIRAGLISSRLSRNWTIEQAFTKPVGSRLASLDHNGITKTYDEWGATIGISGTTIQKRLKAGWSVEKALTTPLHGTRKKTPDH